MKTMLWQNGPLFDGGGGGGGGGGGSSNNSNGVLSPSDMAALNNAHAAENAAQGNGGYTGSFDTAAYAAAGSPLPPSRPTAPATAPARPAAAASAPPSRAAAVADMPARASVTASLPPASAPQSSFGFGLTGARAPTGFSAPGTTTAAPSSFAATGLPATQTSGLLSFAPTSRGFASSPNAMSATNYGVAPGREAGIGSPIGPGRVGVNSAPASRGSASRSELDTLAFDPGPLSGPGYAMTGAQLTSASTSPHAATYDAPPLDGRTGAGSRSVQTAPERGIEIGNRELDALGRVQAAENPRHSGTGAEAWTALNRVASPATWWGRDIEGVVNAPSQFTPVLDAPGRSVWGLPRSPEAEQSLRGALNAPNPVPGMTHFANPNALGNRAGASTRAWVSAADANPDNPRVGGHVFANVDRTSVPNFTPVVTAGLNQFTPTTPIPPTRAQMAGTAQPASAPQTAQVNIDKYINPDPLTYAQVVERDPSQIDFESIFAQNPSARPSTNTDPSPPVRTASAGAGGLFGISPAAAATAPPPSTQAFAGPRAADLMEPGMPATASAQPRSPDPSIAPQNLGPGLTIPNAPDVAQSAPSQNVAEPNAQGGVDIRLDAAEPEGRTTAQKAAGYAGQGVGSMMGGVIGTGIAGPMGGLAGGLLGGWLGGKMGDGQPNQTPWTDSDSASYGSGGESPQPESAPDAVASSPAENVKRLEEKYLGLPMWREPGAGNGRPTPRQRFVENRSNYGRSL